MNVFLIITVNSGIPVTTCTILRLILIFQVTLNAFVSANGCDGDIAGGHGGIIQTSTNSIKIMVNPGRGQSMHEGKVGTVLSK